VFVFGVREVSPRESEPFGLVATRSFERPCSERGACVVLAAVCTACRPLRRILGRSREIRRLANRVAPQGPHPRRRVRRREVRRRVGRVRRRGGRRHPGEFPHRRQMPALDVHVPGLAGRCGRQRRGAVRVREPGVAARLRAAARRRDGCVVVASGPPRGARAIRPMASQAWIVRAAGQVRRIGGDPARRSVPDLGRADAARERHRVSPPAAGVAALRRHAHRAGLRPICRSRKRCPRPAVAGGGVGGGAPQVGQLHGAPAVGDRCGDERLR